MLSCWNIAPINFYVIQKTIAIDLHPSRLPSIRHVTTCSKCPYHSPSTSTAAQSQQFRLAGIRCGSYDASPLASNDWYGEVCSLWNIRMLWGELGWCLWMTVDGSVKTVKNHTKGLMWRNPINQAQAWASCPLKFMSPSAPGLFDLLQCCSLTRWQSKDIRFFSLHTKPML